MEYIKLKDIAIQIKDGDWIESKDQSSEGIRLIQTGNVGEGQYIDKIDKAKFISDETFENLKCTEIFENDILISRLPSPVGRACLMPKIEGRAITAVDCTILKIDESKCMPKYFIYYTMSERYKKQVEKFVVGSTRVRISRKNLETIDIAVPTIEKQKKIVEVLDKAQSLIDKKNEQIELLDELVKSRFIEMFGDPRINPKGWEKDKLENLTYKITDGKHGDCKNEENSGYYFISAKDINNRKINTDTARQITKEDFVETNKRTDLREKDLVVVNTGSIGKTAIATKSDVLKNLTFQKSVAIITTNDKLLNSEFLENYIIFDLDNICRSSSGTAQKNWLLSQIRGYKIILPPIELQNEFAEFVTQTDSIRSKMESSLSELEDNFNSLMQKAFKGELF